MKDTGLFAVMGIAIAAIVALIMEVLRAYKRDAYREGTDAQRKADVAQADAASKAIQEADRAAHAKAEKKIEGIKLHADKALSKPTPDEELEELARWSEERARRLK